MFQIFPAQQNVLKLTLALPGGALGVLGMHLQFFSVNYALIFLSALGVQVNPLHSWLRLRLISFAI